MIKAPLGLIADHKVPYSISLDDSKDNIQFLTKQQHIEKTIIDIKILKEFRKEGFIEKITNYSIALKVPFNFLKEEYLKRYKLYSGNKYG